MAVARSIHDQPIIDKWATTSSGAHVTRWCVASAQPSDHVISNVFRRKEIAAEILPSFVECGIFLCIFVPPR
jgi:hypothetical protein